MNTASLHGPRLSLAEYESTQVTGNAARALDAETLSLRRAIRGVREARQKRRGFCDPLLARHNNRHIVLTYREVKPGLPLRPTWQRFFDDAGMAIDPMPALSGKAANAR